MAVAAPPAVSRHLQALGGMSRRTGTSGAAAGRAYCAGMLGDAGFIVTEQEFEYSEAIGGWATPVAGFLLALSAVGMYLGRLYPRLEPPSIGLLALTIVGLVYVARRGVLDLPVLRRRGVNVVARRGVDEPPVWLVAHVDSKSQPVPMIARVAGVIATVIGLGGLLLIVLTGARIPVWMSSPPLILCWLGCTPLMLSLVGGANDGTLDNASGVAVVLHAIERLPSTASVGVLLTDAEELGLAGARAWVRGRAPGVAINCDSVDDRGQMTVMYSGKAPARLIGLLTAAAATQGVALRTMRLIPGILTDSVALADAGWMTLTLSRGDARTLARIHTRRDTLATMHGAGIHSAAMLIAHAATELG